LPAAARGAHRRRARASIRRPGMLTPLTGIDSFKKITPTPRARVMSIAIIADV
jgi:hypothetical protein